MTAKICFKWIVFILVLSSIFPLIYFFKMYNPPEGYVFVGRHIDDGMNAAVMKSYMWNYMDPFGSGNVSIFNNPIPGPPYLLLMLGVASNLLGIDSIIFIFLLTYFFTAAYLIVIYYVMGLFSDKAEQDMAFILFSVATGVGGILYAILGEFGNFSPGQLIHLVIGGPIFSVTIIYYLVSLVTGYTFLFFLVKGRRYIATIMLGLTILFYPYFGVTFFVIGAMFCVIEKKSILMLLPSMAFFIPWMISYFQGGTYSQFSQVAAGEYYNIFAFLANGGFTLVFSGITVIFFIKRKNKNMFVVIWALFLVVLLFIQNPFIPKTRFVHLVWVPLSILAAKGITQISRNERMKERILAFVVILALPSIILGFIAVYGQVGYYMTSDEFSAVKFLGQEQSGTVFSSFEIGTFIPYYSGKTSVRGERQESPEVEKDYTVFFSNDSYQDKLTILDKYNITYIFFGNYEKSVSGGSFDPDKVQFLQRMYKNNEVSLYRVKI